MMCTHAYNVHGACMTPHNGVPLGVSNYILLVGGNVWVRANKYYIYTSFRNILHIYKFVDTLLLKY